MSELQEFINFIVKTRELSQDLWQNIFNSHFKTTNK